MGKKGLTKKEDVEWQRQTHMNKNIVQLVEWKRQNRLTPGKEG